MRPSPARAEAPEPDAWIPILDLAPLDELDAELVDLERRFHEPAVALAPVPVPVPAAAPATQGSLRRAAKLLLLGAVLALVLAAVPFFGGARPQHRVALRLDRQEFLRTTRAATVGSFLRSEGVRLRPGDRVVPAAATSLRNGLALRVLRAFPVRVDVDGASRTVHTTRRSPVELARELRLPAATVVTGSPERLDAGATVVFRTPHTVTFAVDGFDGPVRTTGLTVRDLLHEHAIALGPLDLVSPGASTRLTAGMVITIARAAPNSITDDVVVSFTTHQPVDPSLAPGWTRVVQPGVDGLDRVTYRPLVLDGHVVGRTVISTITVRPVQSRIVAVGPPASFAGRAVAATAHFQEGPASWYDTLHQPGTCAHLDISEGTAVRVVNTATGAWTTCTVADRGPEAWTGNIIDLAPDVFSRIGLLSDGVVHVRLEW